MTHLVNKKRIASCLLLASIGLSGCSDNDSNNLSVSLPSSSASSLEGTFVDSAVDGLTYSGTSRSGTTSGGGHYQFDDGDSVTFSLGSVLRLGTLLAKEDAVSPLDFFTEIDMSDPRLRSILVLLQSLDSDGDTSNGITITEEAVTLLLQELADAGYTPADLILSEMTEADAALLLAALPAILTEVVNATSSPDDVVVSEEDAVTHFASVIGGISIHKNVSRTPEQGSGGHSIASMTVVTDSATSSGSVDASVQVHPLLVSYTDVVLGDFEMGTGSSEIPDIEHMADVFVATSLDNGSTWKIANLSNTAEKSSIQVDYYGDGQLHDYNGHSFKPAIKTEGNRVVVAWNDKFCASGNPLGLENTGTQGDPIYADDLYQVNGPQGSIDYEGVETYAGEVVEAHEVPFSCVMTARGTFDAATHTIIWHAPLQLTTGRRDSNKITIASGSEGFVISWQEDPVGLRPGGGAGPGEGWSGASTNHRTDIWYSYLTTANFDATDGEVVDGDTTKPKSLNNFSYPVPVSDNAVCRADNVSAGTAALYCVDLCNDNGSLDDATSNDDGKCYSGYDDPITVIYAAANTPDVVVEPQLLNGDTGASRPILGLFGTQVILGYEETKGLAENLPGIPNTESDDIPVEQQGKIAYVHSFEMTTPDAVAPGTIVNPLRPNEADGTPVLENVRRLTLVAQVDSSEAAIGTDYLWGILYKSGIETQGASSDMYFRPAKTYDAAAIALETTPNWNLSARTADADETVKGTWDQTNLDDATWENEYENTFSPRGFLRGSSIIIGYEYTPSWRVAQQGHLSNNFHVIRSTDNGATWLDPIDISNITNNVTSTLDPRLIPAPEAIPGSPLASDIANPDVMFVSYGTVDLQTGIELDLYVTRSVDGGATWEKVPSNLDGSDVNDTISKTAAEEKEVQGIATPDGNTLYSLWLQELDPEEAPEGTPDHILGSDIWIQRRDYVTDM